MSVIISLGVVVVMVTSALTMPPSRELMLKLGTLVDMARRANPELFRAQIEPINPFVGRAFKHHRVTGLLRADFSQFGEISQRLQREARRLDRKVHRGLIPGLVYLVAVGVWYVLRS